MSAFTNSACGLPLSEPINIPSVPLPSSVKPSNLSPIAIKLSFVPACSLILSPKRIFSLAESMTTFVDCILVSSTVNPPILPPVNSTDEPVTLPLPLTLKLELLMKNPLGVGEPDIDTEKSLE